MTPERIIPYVPPMECLPVSRLPDGPNWVFELKLDGYRLQAISDSHGVQLVSRRGNDFTGRYPTVANALSRSLPRGTALDGEIVALDPEGHPSFNLLQNARPQTPVVFYAFDVLIQRWKDVKPFPLSQRSKILSNAFEPSDYAQICENFGGPSSRMIEAVRAIGGEGVVAKRLDSRYELGQRTGAWQKMRINVGQEFVIGGYVPGAQGVESLVVGLYEGKQLRYVARVRAGLVAVQRRELFARLRPLTINTCPFKGLPDEKSGRWGQGLTAEKMRECVWVRPEVVANFEFLEWTEGGHVRHIKFVGLRDDKDPQSVVRETRPT